jgi:hypothetical protein
MVGLWLGAAAAELGSAGCNEPVETSFGNPNSLDRKNLPGEGGAEPLVCSGDAAPAVDGGGCPSFATDIFPYLVATGQWKCTDSKCHNGAQAPEIASDTPANMLASLKKITVGLKPYIASGEAGKDPTASAMLCNLQGGCGSRMPQPPGIDPTTTELCVVQAWLACGAPP